MFFEIHNTYICNLLSYKPKRCLILKNYFVDNFLVSIWDFSIVTHWHINHFVVTLNCKIITLPHVDDLRSKRDHRNVILWVLKSLRSRPKKNGHITIILFERADWAIFGGKNSASIEWGDGYHITRESSLYDVRIISEIHPKTRNFPISSRRSWAILQM